MKTARSFFSATTALGLVSFTLVAALTAGVSSPVTQIAFGLLAVYGLVEIAVLSYTPRRYVALGARRPVPVRALARVTVRVPAMVEYPVRHVRAA